MAYEKIVTCCYCGTRAALVLKGDQKHALACSSCGAPITQMKHLKKSAPVSDPATAGGYHVSSQAYGLPHVAKSTKPSKPKKKKHKAKKSYKMFKEVFDLIEDIFD